jgi:MFS transporter, DHA1 family, solute carrier family 18 (vesicular amine transporter), member 1/2
MKDWRVLGVVAYALLMDDFIYELVVPLIPNTPVGKLSDDRMALLYGAYVLGVLLATPCFGYLGSRFGCKRIMLVGVSLSSATVALFWWAPSYDLLQVARFCQGAASAATWTAGLALIAEHYVKDRVAMMGYALVGNTAGSMLGRGELFQLGG